jgi:hypothetical protein
MDQNNSTQESAPQAPQQPQTQTPAPANEFPRIDTRTWMEKGENPGNLVKKEDSSE